MPAQEAWDRAVAAMKRKGFDVLCNHGDESTFYKIISVSVGSCDGLRAFWDGGSVLTSEPVVGLAAVETVMVSKRHVEAGTVDRIESMQSIEPLIVMEGGIELALETGRYLGVARSQEEAMEQWGARLTKQE